MTDQKCSVSISRITSNHDAPCIRIEVRDATSWVEFLQLEMSMEAFALAVTGVGEQPAVFDLRGVKFVGMRHETKTELVPRPAYASPNERAKVVAESLLPFEVDGWVGRGDDLWNYHKAVGDKQRVHFSRYVKVEVDG